MALIKNFNYKYYYSGKEKLKSLRNLNFMLRNLTTLLRNMNIKFHFYIKKFNLIFRFLSTVIRFLNIKFGFFILIRFF